MLAACNRATSSGGRLDHAGIVRIPAGRQAKELFLKRGVGHYGVILARGPYFDGKQAGAVRLAAEDSPLVDPLRAIGFDDAAIRRILREYPIALVQQWADITLAARERNGDAFFSKSPAAYFTDNVRHASEGRRSPPDWWREMRREEFRRQREAEREQLETVSVASEERAFQQYLEGEAREAFENVMQRLVSDLTSRGKSAEEAAEPARYLARLHFLNRFRQERSGENS